MMTEACLLTGNQSPSRKITKEEMNNFIRKERPDNQDSDDDRPCIEPDDGKKIMDRPLG